MLVGWCLAGAGLVALLIAAVSKKEKDVCKGYEVRIHGASEQLFLDKAEIVKLIAGPTILGMPVKEIDLRKMEEKLEKQAKPIRKPRQVLPPFSWACGMCGAGPFATSKLHRKHVIDHGKNLAQNSTAASTQSNGMA